MPDYSLDNLAERARLVREEMSASLEVARAAYAKRRAAMRELKVPVVSFVGHGRAGKDTAAQMFCARARLTYGGSTSLVAVPYVALAAGDHQYECYTGRHSHREFWFHFLNEFRRGEPDLIAKMLLAQGDVLAGVRAAEEFRCLIPNGVADIHVWIDRRGTPEDPTVEFTRDECDLVIDNNGSLVELDEKVGRLARLITAQR